MSVLLTRGRVDRTIAAAVEASAAYAKKVGGDEQVANSHLLGQMTALARQWGYALAVPDDRRPGVDGVVGDVPCLILYEEDEPDDRGPVLYATAVVINGAELPAEVFDEDDLNKQVMEALARMEEAA